MCNTCGYKNGSTKHLLYWQAEWLKRFLLTWWHIINRKAYWKWCEKNCKSFRNKKIDSMVYDINEGFRMEFDSFLNDK